MSISGGEFDAQQPQEHEEEKVRHAKPILNKGKGDGTGEKIETIAPPPPKFLIFEEGKDGFSVGPRGGHAPPPPAGRRNPTRAHAPKPLPNSPIVVEELKERLKKKSPFMTPPKSSPPLDKEGSPAPTITSNERTTFNYGRNHNEQTGHEHDSISAASFVVCGVDGTVYTLDAYTGKLRNMFATGPLVFSSSPNKDHTSDGTFTDATNGQGDDTAIDDIDGDSRYAIAPKVSHVRKERVIPGLLDGRLYSLFEFEGDGVGDGNEDKPGGCQFSADEDYDNVDKNCGSVTSQARSGPILTPHHIRVMDVVDSPFSICSDGDTQQKQCGIIMGSKKITIFAIDPTTGKVRWTQDPQGGAGRRGYTTHPPKTTARGRTVLLQREDYAVRHTDTDEGKEVWKVELGMFSALVTPQSGGVQGVNSDDDVFAGERSTGGVHVGSGRKRGVAAMAASLDSEDKKRSGVSPILGRKKTSLLELDDAVFGDSRHAGGRKESLFDNRDDDDNHDHSFRGLPSIAFGKVSVLPCSDYIDAKIPPYYFFRT
jgi:outer membrane protein assembly factor BamB